MSQHGKYLPDIQWNVKKKKNGNSVNIAPLGLKNITLKKSDDVDILSVYKLLQHVRPLAFNIPKVKVQLVIGQDYANLLA